MQSAAFASASTNLDYTICRRLFDHGSRSIRSDSPGSMNIFNVAGVIAAAIVFVCVLVKSKTNPDAARWSTKLKTPWIGPGMHRYNQVLRPGPLKRSRDFYMNEVDRFIYLQAGRDLIRAILKTSRALRKCNPMKW